MITSSLCATILQVSDLHIGATTDATLQGVNTAFYFQKVLAHAFSQHAIDYVVLTGDLAQTPCYSSYHHIKGYLAPYHVPCFCLPGNHDDYAIMEQIFIGEYFSCQKQIILENWQIICLNSQLIGSAKGYLASEELSFLEACLSAQPRHHALIAMHHHCLPTHSHWLDTMMISNNQQLFTITHRFPQAKAIIYGHIHQNAENKLGTMMVWGTPSTCFQFKPHSPGFALDSTSSGYRIVQLYNTGEVISNVFYLPEPLLGLQLDAGGY